MSGARASSWSDLLRTLGRSLSALTRAEVDAVAGELRGSSRQLIWGVFWVAAAAAFLFWGLAVLTWAAVEGLAVVWPRWLAALAVGGVLLLFCSVGALLGRSRFRRVEAPFRTVKRRAQEHREWWTERILGAGQDRVSHDAEGISGD